MLLKIFTIFDQKAAAYLPPFFLLREEMAIRTFADCANSADHQFGKHPADYTLITLGSFNDVTSIFELLEVPLVLGVGIEYVKKPDTTDKE